MDDAQRTIDVVIKSAKVTSDILKAALIEILNNPNKSKQGKMNLNDLSIKANGKLESIEITENNIKDFRNVARKYNIDYSLKRDKSTNPPTYHVFFATNDTENFKRAFKEYAVGISNKQKNKKVEVSKDQIKNLAVQVTEKADKNKQKVRTKEKQVSRWMKSIRK